MDKSNLKKKEQLGKDAGTAANQLRKEILFKYVKQAGENFCFQCGLEIEKPQDLSIEHKIPWLDSENPAELFHDLDNIAFSHLSCNVGAARKKYSVCGTINSYEKGCRCKLCREARALKAQKNREKKKG